MGFFGPYLKSQQKSEMEPHNKLENTTLKSQKYYIDIINLVIII